MSTNKFKLFTIIFCLLLLLSSLHFANAGTGTEITDYDKIGNFVRSEMQVIRIPGLSVGIVENGKVIYLKGFGYSDTKGTVVTPQTNFYIGSITKNFTALAIRQLINEGKIIENAPVTRYLPWFQTNYKTASDNIRIIDLIKHTSGFSQEDGMAFVCNSPGESLEQSIRCLDKVKLKSIPGAKYDYSNINYSILGLIVEKVSGNSYSEYMKENIFSPLGMVNTFVVESDGLAQRVATSHKVGFGTAIPVYPRVRLNTVPSGYISSSAEDLCTYTAAYIENGIRNGRSLATNGTPFSIDLMESEKGGYQLHYDMYWNHVEKDLKLEINPTGFTGAFPCTMAEMLVNPGKHLGIVALANSRNDKVAFIHDITMGIADILEGGIPEVASDRDFNRSYIIIDAISLIIFLLVITHLVMSAAYIRKLRNSKKPGFTNIISSILIDFIIPLIILFGIPQLVVHLNNLNYNWSGIIFDGAQELLYVYILSWVLLGVGTIRSICTLIFTDYSRLLY